MTTTQTLALVATSPRNGRTYTDTTVDLWDLGPLAQTLRANGWTDVRCVDLDEVPSGARDLSTILD